MDFTVLAMGASVGGSIGATIGNAVAQAAYDAVQAATTDAYAVQCSSCYNIALEVSTVGGIAVGGAATAALLCEKNLSNAKHSKP